MKGYNSNRTVPTMKSLTSDKALLETFKSLDVVIVDDLLRVPFGKLIRNRVIVRNWDKISYWILSCWFRYHSST